MLHAALAVAFLTFGFRSWLPRFLALPWLRNLHYSDRLGGAFCKSVLYHASLFCAVFVCQQIPQPAHNCCTRAACQQGCECCNYVCMYVIMYVCMHVIIRYVMADEACSAKPALPRAHPSLLCPTGRLVLSSTPAAQSVIL